jgi:hypothetical protein
LQPEPPLISIAAEVVAAAPEDVAVAMAAIVDVPMSIFNVGWISMSMMDFNLKLQHRMQGELSGFLNDKFDPWLEHSEHQGSISQGRRGTHFQP